MASDVMRPASVIAMLHTYWPHFRDSRKTAIALDAWVHGRQYSYTDDKEDPFYGRPYAPEGKVGDEYNNLSELAPSPWGGLVVDTLAQTAVPEGIMLPGANDNLESWATWQENRMDARWPAIARGAIGHGAAYGFALPAKSPLTGDKTARIGTRSAKKMAAFYDDDDDEWPRISIEAKRYSEASEDGAFVVKTGWVASIMDDQVTHNLSCVGEGYDKKEWTYISYEPHELGVCPVSRLAHSVDLDGRSMGVVEPIIPMLRRVDQDVFDRLIVQRFGAWAIRYIAGMAKPATTEEQNALEIAMRIDDLLMSTEPTTKFGQLEGTSLDGFIEATDNDLRMIAAITQTPPHHLLGLSANLQAEALNAAEMGLRRKSSDFKLQGGEFLEQLMRLTATIKGNATEARAFDMQTRWRDTSADNFQSAMQGLGIAADTLGIPVEMLWERVPNWTDSDTKRAKRLVEDGSFQKIVQALIGGGGQDVTQVGGTGGGQPSGPAQ